jgi:hypothetical protein
LASRADYTSGRIQVKKKSGLLRSNWPDERMLEYMTDERGNSINPENIDINKFKVIGMLVSAIVIIEAQERSRKRRCDHAGSGHERHQEKSLSAHA